MAARTVTIDPSADPEVVRAAGGIVWWRAGRQVCLAVVHRPKYDDWSLPKGKLQAGESWEAAALREVREETGCEARVIDFAGVVCYLVESRPKVVLFWNMERGDGAFVEATGEVDKVEWLSPRDALGRLQHPAERRLVRLSRGRASRAGKPAAGDSGGGMSGPPSRSGSRSGGYQ